MERNTELINEIGNRLVRDPWLTDEAPDWDQLSLSVRVAPGSVGMSGFTYQNDGERPEPGTPDGDGFFELFRELQSTMAQVSGKTWVACLLQIDRASGKIGFDFEYEDPSRWKVTPANLDTLPRAMRPKE